jgi:hypothetical protein
MKVRKKSIAMEIVNPDAAGISTMKSQSKFAPTVATEADYSIMPQMWLEKCKSI